MKNRDQLLSSDESGLRRIALEAVEAGISEVLPQNLLRNKLRLDRGEIQLGQLKINLTNRRVFVVGAGKAALGLVRALNELVGQFISGGEVASNEVDSAVYVGNVRISPASHPLPSELSERATRRIVDLISQKSGGDLFIVLVTGGGSSMLELPRPPVTVDDEAHLVELLELRGANIRELNTVRKHISEVRGGMLQRLIFPASSITLAISDVIGDSLDIISSGPTVADPSSFSDSLNVLNKYLSAEEIPETVKRLHQMGVSGSVEETPKPGDPVFRTADHFLLGSVTDAALAAKAKLAELGIRSVILTCQMEGEARQVGRLVGRIITSDANRGEFDAIILGGETTVRVKGKGRGGRNQEFVMAASDVLRGSKDVLVVSVGTDGIDGNSQYAGAIADGHTVERAVSQGLDFESMLSDNNSSGFFSALGDAVLTGKTGTNVSDLVLGIRTGKR